MAAKKFSYDDSLKELEVILEELNQGKIGIDKLQDKVKRAKELLEKCRSKLRTTEQEIDELLK